MIKFSCEDVQIACVPIASYEIVELQPYSITFKTRFNFALAFNQFAHRDKTSFSSFPGYFSTPSTCHTATLFNIEY